MFLLVSGRHVGAHPDGHRHGVSIQILDRLGSKWLAFMDCSGHAIIKLGKPLVRLRSVGTLYTQI